MVKYNDTMEIEYKDRIIEIRFKVEYEYIPAKTDGDIMCMHPNESTIGFSDIEIISWMNINADSNNDVLIKEGDKNWKRICKYVPGFIEKIYAELQDYEPKRYI